MQEIVAYKYEAAFFTYHGIVTSHGMLEEWL